jgi:hypothetical protein
VPTCRIAAIPESIERGAGTDKYHTRLPMPYSSAEDEVGAVKVSIDERACPHRFDTPFVVRLYT